MSTQQLLARPLLARLAPAPDESLPSLLCRLTKLNRYPSSVVMRKLCIEQLNPHLDSSLALAMLCDRAWVWLVPTDDLVNAVSGLTALTTPQLRFMSAHRFAPVLTLPDTRRDADTEAYGMLPDPVAFAFAAREHLNPATAARFCPRCLKQSAYHRVTWLPRAVCVCLTHGTFLQDACPGCGERVSIECIVNDCCGRCGHRLSAAKVQKLQAAADALLCSQQRIQSWFGLLGSTSPESANANREEHQRLTASLPSGFLAVTYELALGLATSGRFHAEPTATVNPSRPSGEICETARRWALATEALRDWPHGFTCFLHQFAQANQQRHHLGLGTLYVNWLNGRWRHRAFNFVQEAFALYLRQAYVTCPLSVRQLPHCQRDPALLDQCEVISSGEAARLLDIREQQVRLLSGTGRLAQTHPKLARGQCEQPPGKLLKRRRPVQMFARDQVRLLVGELPVSLHVEQAARFVGCSADLLDSLIDGRVLASQATSRSIRCHDLLRFVAALRQHAPHGHLKQCDTPLALAISHLETIGLGVTELFHKVLSGALPFWLCQRGRVLFLEDSRCDGLALCDWIKSVKADRGWVSVEDVAHAVGVSLQTLRRWIDAGVVPLKAAFGTHQYFDPGVIQRLTAGLLNGDSTKRWLAVPSSTLQTWIVAEWLTPVFVDPRGRLEHFLFDRDQVSQLSDRIHDTQSHFIAAGIGAQWINDMIEAGRLNLLPPNASAHDYESHVLFARPTHEDGTALHS